MIKIYLFKRHYDEVLQKEFNMNDSFPISGWKVCPAASVGSQKFPYICYITENCCEAGCCANRTYHHFKSWLILILIFGIMYSCVWYCMKMERLRKKREREELMNRSRFMTQSPSSSPRALGDTFCAIDFEKFNRNEFDKKGLPKYEEALNMPKIKSTQVAEVHIYDDLNTDGLPTYDDVNNNNNNANMNKY
ncbi:uncharacterized protein LOC130900668 isoform X2 [Diorhabda carinulata]|uniref:uncharacterized protein LOC130900668 isoform X2 n=1 Tax=Diorhabda carinulata TaxID=1163345 RepID=UPI0025A2BCB1|nr:uncharacterized protein LOC130900668 isoform X2 [Diorhabda carinulata]